MMRIVVVLPAPLAPTKPVITPGRTSNETRSRTVWSPYRRVRSVTLSMRPP